MRWALWLILFFNMVSAQKSPKISWKEAASFSEFPENLGLAGMAAAKTDGGFLIAGGANFPNGLPWEGGKKFFSDKIFQWDGTEKAPRLNNLRLPEGLAYSGFVSSGRELVIIGGETASGPSKKVLAITNSGIRQLPDFPLAVIAPAVVAVGKNIYVAGGDMASETSNKFFVLNLDNENAGWKELPALPNRTANAAIFGLKDKIYLASGRSKNKNGISTLNDEIYAFDLKLNQWCKIGKVQVNGNESPFVASSYFTWKNRYLVFCGGDDGKTFHQIETYLSKISAASNEREKSNLTDQKNYLVKHHQGFNNRILIYDTKSGKWLSEEFLPFPAQVTTATVASDDKIYIFSGEVRPGVRSPMIRRATIK